MKDIGFLKIHRKIKDNILFQETRTFSKFEAWMDILMDCNFKEGEFLLGYEIYKVEIGSYVTSKLKLQKKYGWSKGKLNNFLTLLEKQKMISQKTIGEGNNKATQLFVLNYTKYQHSEPINEPLNEPKANPKATLSEPQYKKDKKDNKEKNIISSIDNEISKEISPLKNKIDFKELCKTIDLSFYIDKYELTELDFKSEANEFYKYWTEKSANGKKERWEKEKVFDVVRRFDTWLRNNEKWSKKNISFKPSGIGHLD